MLDGSEVISLLCRGLVVVMEEMVTEDLDWRMKLLGNTGVLGLFDGYDGDRGSGERFLWSLMGVSLEVWR